MQTAICCRGECFIPLHCQRDDETSDIDARAAILAVLNGIREPSEGMKLAGARSIDRPMWQAMIDAKKKEIETPA